jgi:hypothetical protein
MRRHFFDVCDADSVLPNEREWLFHLGRARDEAARALGDVAKDEVRAITVRAITVTGARTIWQSRCARRWPGDAR